MKDTNGNEHPEVDEKVREGLDKIEESIAESVSYYVFAQKSWFKIRRWFYVRKCWLKLIWALFLKKRKGYIKTFTIPKISSGNHLEYKVVPVLATAAEYIEIDFKLTKERDKRTMNESMYGKFPVIETIDDDFKCPKCGFVITKILFADIDTGKPVPGEKCPNCKIPWDYVIQEKDSKIFIRTLKACISVIELIIVEGKSPYEIVTGEPSDDTVEIEDEPKPFPNYAVSFLKIEGSLDGDIIRTVEFIRDNQVAIAVHSRHKENNPRKFKSFQIDLDRENLLELKDWVDHTLEFECPKCYKQIWPTLKDNKCPHCGEIVR